MTDQKKANIRIKKDGIMTATLSGSESIARAVIDAGARVAANW